MFIQISAENPAAMNIERGIIEGAGFQRVSAQCKNEGEVDAPRTAC